MDQFDITKKRLMYDNVLVRPVEVTKTESFIVDVNQYGDKPEIGEVVSVGSGRLLEDGSMVDMIVSVGDIVMFNKYASTKLRNVADKKDYYIIREEDIIVY